MKALPCPKEFVTFADTLADAVRPIIKQHFRTRLDIISKSDDSPVTIADRAAEKQMRQMINATFPAHGIWGEEFGVENPDAEWCWVLDPIDGTKSFVSGSFAFGTQIGLAHQGLPVLGIIDQPFTGERWQGIAGASSLLDGKALKTSAITDIEQAVLYSSAPEQVQLQNQAAFSRLSSEVSFTRYSHDCYAAGLLAMGMVDVLAEANVFNYDIVPQIPIIETAGGVVSDWNGNPLGAQPQYDTVLMSANKTLHARCLELLAS